MSNAGSSITTDNISARLDSLEQIMSSCTHASFLHPFSSTKSKRRLLKWLLPVAKASLNVNLQAELALKNRHRLRWMRTTGAGCWIGKIIPTKGQRETRQKKGKATACVQMPCLLPRLWLVRRISVGSTWGTLMPRGSRWAWKWPRICEERKFTLTP